MNIIPVLDEVEHTLSSVSIRRSTSEKTNCTFGEDIAAGDEVNTKELYVVEALESLTAPSYLVKLSPAVHQEKVGIR